MQAAFDKRWSRLEGAYKNHDILEENLWYQPSQRKDYGDLEQDT